MSNDVLLRLANPAANNGDQQHPVHEMADLWCHTLVLLGPGRLWLLLCGAAGIRSALWCFGPRGTNLGITPIQQFLLTSPAALIRLQLRGQIRGYKHMAVVNRSVDRVGRIWR